MKRFGCGWIGLWLCCAVMWMSSSAFASEDASQSEVRPTLSLSLNQVPCPLSSQSFSASQVTPVSLTLPVDITAETLDPPKGMPEPATIALIGIGAVTICSSRKRVTR